ncbi:hypothetical protein Tco_0748307 [Tanacetum coccineum]|uniref:Uncharacterized protein n=1 Tax=Tanacetum coccineum TaxID=301880 RepID=A0ABQ4YXS8_9ASTR
MVLKVSTSSPLVSPSSIINVPRELYSIDVAATLGVPLTTVGDLQKLINDIDAGKHNELLSELTNEDRMETLEALGSICNSIKIDRNNVDVIPLHLKGTVKKGKGSSSSNGIPSYQQKCDSQVLMLDVTFWVLDMSENKVVVVLEKGGDYDNGEKEDGEEKVTTNRCTRQLQGQRFNECLQYFQQGQGAFDQLWPLSQESKQGSKCRSAVPMCSRTSGVPKIPTDAGLTRWTVRSAEDPTVEEMAQNLPRSCMDIANIIRKWSKPDKHGHETEKSVQEPGI